MHYVALAKAAELWQKLHTFLQYVPTATHLYTAYLCTEIDGHDVNTKLLHACMHTHTY